MGYYSQFDYNIKNAKVALDKITEIETLFSNDNNEDVSGFYNVSLEVDAENYLISINPIEYTRKFYDDRFFAEKLSEAIINGEVRLYFTGEDGEKWGYIVTPNSVKEITTIWVSMDELPYVTQFLNSIRNK